MRIFFLVLLLILNVYAEAKGSGSARSQSQAKKDKSAVVAKKSQTSKSGKSSAKGSKTSKSKKSRSTVSESANPDNAPAIDESRVVEYSSDYSADTSAVALDSSTVDTSSGVIVVRDTVVDTVYVVMPDTTSKQTKRPCNIPLPRQSAFLGAGISVGVGAGLFNASKDCDCLGVWQGQLEYHYKDYISGGFDVRFFGGTLDRDVMLLYQRYRLNAKFHKSFSGADFYAGVMLGLETTDLSEFRKELHEGIHGGHSDETDSSKVVSEVDGDSSTSETSSEIVDPEKNCEKMFSLDGFTLGLEVGMGVVVSRYIGFTGSASYEFNLSWAQLVSVSPGIAFNLQEIWPWAGKNLRSTWISFEMIFQRYFNRDVNEWAVAGFLGLQFGI